MTAETWGVEQSDNDKCYLWSFKTLTWDTAIDHMSTLGLELSEYTHRNKSINKVKAYVNKWIITGYLEHESFFFFFTNIIGQWVSCEFQLQLGVWGCSHVESTNICNSVSETSTKNDTSMWTAGARGTCNSCDSATKALFTQNQVSLQTAKFSII